MTRPTKTICEEIDAFHPVEGNWLPLDALLEELFASEHPFEGIPTMLRLLERFPQEEGAGVLWGVVHGMESLEGYEPALVRSVSQAPSHLGVVLVGRLLRSGTTCVDGVQLTGLLERVADEEGAPAIVRRTAEGFLPSSRG